ncbi:glycosyl hydrolase [Sphingomonas sp. 22176]|uniref:glycosyl hydrolase n=1 Tax=Sphingomonas sp. 22176 TaxID=3453884 RepID=UPI003F85084A
MGKRGVGRSAAAQRGYCRPAGLRLGIASSPGWSSSGAPLVTPEPARRKLVCNELRVTGSRRFDGAPGVAARCCRTLSGRTA